MTKYAEGTKVPVHRSKADIESQLKRFGATHFLYGVEETRAVIAFRIRGRQVRFELPLPDRDDDDIIMTTTGKGRTDAQIEAAFDQEVRRRWRSLALVIKAKLEAVQSGIVTFEEEFMAHIMLPDGQTVGEYMQPQIEVAYETGNMPKLLPDYGRES